MKPSNSSLHYRTSFHWRLTEPDSENISPASWILGLFFSLLNLRAEESADRAARNGLNRSIRCSVSPAKDCFGRIDNKNNMKKTQLFVSLQWPQQPRCPQALYTAKAELNIFFQHCSWRGAQLLQRRVMLLWTSDELAYSVSSACLCSDRL